jgi:hypothetical protein
MKKLSRIIIVAACLVASLQRADAAEDWTGGLTTTAALRPNPDVATPAAAPVDAADAVNPSQIQGQKNLPLIDGQLKMSDTYTFDRDEVVYNDWYGSVFALLFVVSDHLDGKTYDCPRISQSIPQLSFDRSNNTLVWDGVVVATCAKDRMTWMTFEYPCSFTNGYTLAVSVKNTVVGRKTYLFLESPIVNVDLKLSLVKSSTQPPANH